MNMEVLIWIGAVLTVAGLLGLIGCILSAMRAKREGLSDDELRARLQKIVAKNLGSLFLSAIGLMMIVAGMLLG